MTVNFASSPDLFTVEFPGYVKNAAKAIGMIGGSELLKTCLNKICAPDLFWRRDDDFSKPISGEKCVSRRKLVLRVKRDSRGQINVSVVGIIRFEIRFSSLACCQYLPVVQNSQEKSSYLSIQKSLLPIDVRNYGYITASEDETPLFVVPPLFLRSNRPPFTFYRCKTLAEVLSIDCEELEKFEDVRGNRSVNWFTVKYGDPIPTVEEHAKEISNTLSSDFPEIYGFLKQLFVERPIWSTTAVRWRFTSSFQGVINSSRMLSFLGQVAYYIENGPWQRLWCRIGYDPQKHPSESKVYQVVDFRLSRVILKAQAFSDTLSSLSSKSRGSHCFSDISSVLSFPNPPHVFKQGVVPALACTYFQVCDIELPEIQRLINENDGFEPAECHRVDGFLVKDYGNTFRRLMIASLLPPDKVQAFIARDMLSDKRKKRKRHRPGQKRLSKSDTGGDTVKNYISTVGAALGVGRGQDSSPTETESESEEAISSSSSSSYEDVDEDEDDFVEQAFMNDNFGNRPETIDYMQQQTLATLTAPKSEPSSSEKMSSQTDLRRLWQETSSNAFETEATLEFPQL